MGTLAVGETGLQLVRYGTGEARLTGAVRTDGILRALGGGYFGAFTTTQRDAIASGSRPYGLVILNTTTNRLEINIGSDAAPSWTGLSASISRGTLGTRPSASAANSGSWYFATDDNGGTLYYSDGSVWTKVSRGLTQALDANSVGTTQIADGSVTTAKHADASITNAKLASEVATIPVGGVIEWPWAAGSIPAWSLLPYGQAIAQASYPALNTLDSASARPHGTSAGNIVLPDMRGRVSVGKDDMGGTIAGRITAAITGVAGTTLGAVFGAEGITLTTAQIPAHNHGITGAPSFSDPGHAHGASSSAETTDHTHTFSGTSSGQSVGHTHAVTDTGHSHGITDGGHSHGVSDNHWHYITNSGGQLIVGGNNSGNGPSHTDDSVWANDTTRADRTVAGPSGGAVSVNSGTTGVSVNGATTGVSVGSNSVDHTHTYSGTTSGRSVGHTHAITVNNGTTGITVGVGTLGTGNSGSGNVHQNTQPSIVVNKLMRVV